MNPQHTPSPWALSDDPDPLVFNSRGDYVAQVLAYAGGSLRPGYAADARLIVAAPDLLSALQNLVAATQPTYDNRHELAGARDAIARATGGAA